jgi:hypothetical protein
MERRERKREREKNGGKEKGGVEIIWEQGKGK